MSATFVEIAFSSDAVFSVFNQVAREAAKPQRMLDEVGAFLDSDLTRRFHQGVDPSGNPWKASQRAQAEGGKTLIDTAVLVSGVTHDVQGNTLRHGLTEIYAAIHQFGGKAGRNRSVTIPKREMIGIKGAQQAGIDRICLRWAKGWFK